jgi:hypothetical protein
MEALVRWGGRFCVAFVWAFCAVGYWAVWHYVFIPNVMYTAQEPFHVLVLSVFHVLVVLCLYSYYCAISTDPGFVPPGYVRSTAPSLTHAHARTLHARARARTHMPSTSRTHVCLIEMADAAGDGRGQARARRTG